MDLTDGLTAGRAASEQYRMVDTCTITRAGERIYNEATKQYEQTSTTVYTGKCEVKAPNPYEPSTPEFGGREITLQPVVVKVPMDSIADKGDTVTIDSSKHDPHLAGATYTVQLVQRKTHSTSRRLLCEEATG